MEVGLHDHGVYKSSRIREDKTLEEMRNGDLGAKKGDGKRVVEKPEKKQNEDVSVEIIDDDFGRSRNSDHSSKAEILCRICHFGDDESSDDSQLISLGCDCRGELGFSHSNCAAIWFSQKGNRVCEICGKTAKNIINHDDDDNNSEVGNEMLMMDLNEMRLVIEAIENSNESSRRCKISLCNFLLGCLLLAFVLPWFFRGIDML